MGIIIAARAGEALLPILFAHVVPQRGIEGDRYFTGIGSFSRWPGSELDELRWEYDARTVSPRRTLMSRNLYDLLRPLVRTSLALDVKKASAPLSVVASKFGGMPYFESGEGWPQCPTCKQPLSFVCQVDLRGVNAPVRAGFHFFTFFYCWDCLPWGFDSEAPGEWLVRHYKNPQASQAAIIVPPPTVVRASECEVSFIEKLSLPDWEGAARWCSQAMELAAEVNSEAPWEVYRDAVQRIAGEQEIESRIGGYPHWIQGNCTPDGTAFLAQIDSEDQAGIMWGDVGCVYLFVSDHADATARMVLQCC